MKRLLTTTGSKIGNESVKVRELSDDIVEADLTPLKEFFNTDTWVLIQQAGDVCLCVCVCVCVCMCVLFTLPT